VVSTISRFQHPKGGFGGGPGQVPHLAPTYAAVNALAIVGTKEAYDCVDRKSLYEWLMRLKRPDGSFVMHEDGEIDVRGSYCAMSVAKLLNILTPELEAGVGEFVARCQTYEGGIGGFPGVEAHGGYTFCGLAAVDILGKADLLDLEALKFWATHRQMQVEGGFQGRTNKLVDGCYSFWQGGLFALLERWTGTPTEALCNRDALQEYILICCQEDRGGLKDKPGKSPDYYHTCYCLSGLSASQHAYRNVPGEG
ncbi:hypothetical protein HK102_010715, partial [Quaeritorhiza haematococci]